MKEIISESDILGFISAILSVIVTIYIFKVTPKYQLVKERYDNLIFPIFNTLEPHLFMPVKSDILEQVFAIIESNKSLAGGKLLEIHYLCNEHPNQEQFNTLCNYINSEYDKLCFRLGLKRRSIIYRINRKQYSSKIMFVVYIAIFVISNLIVFALAFVLFLLIFSFAIMQLEKISLILPNK